MELYFPLFSCTLILTYILYDAKQEEAHLAVYEALKIKHVFYCSSCRLLYKSYKTAVNCPCPRCSSDHMPLKF